MQTLTRMAERARERTGGSRSTLSWPMAVLIAMGLTAVMIITLGFIPSIFTYWWSGQSQQIFDLINRLAGRELIKDQYMIVRIRDIISMGYQSTVFAVFIVVAYLWGEKRRRRLGQRGSDDVKGYLPGK